jgi:hypothetical protein
VPTADTCFTPAGITVSGGLITALWFCLGAVARGWINAVSADRDYHRARGDRLEAAFDQAQDDHAAALARIAEEMARARGRAP